MMSSKTLKHLRIAVLINEQDSDDQKDGFQNLNLKYEVKAGPKCDIEGAAISPMSAAKDLSSDNLELDNMKAEILLIDNKCLQLNLTSTEDCGPYTNISHKMHFDNVGNSNSDIMRRELDIVMDNLLLKRKNSSIMHFAYSKESNIPIFFHLLVRFLYKRIHHQKYKLQYIKLECLEISPGVKHSNHQTIEKGFCNLAYNSPDDCNPNEVIFRFPTNSKFQFRTIQDLLLWLVNEYRFKFPANKGHEKLEFSFSIVDHQQNLFKVKLSFFNIFLNLMNTEDRNHWHHYMDHVGEGCKGADCKFVHSGLTVSLSNYIDGIACANSLLLFAVPANIHMTATTIEMLQMAHSAIKNRRKKLFLLSTNVNLNSRLPPASNISECLAPQQKDRLNNSMAVNYKNPRQSDLPRLTKRHSLGVFLYDGTYSSKDFNILSCWYRKIDARFEKFFQLRQTYYNRYFKLKIKLISSNINNMFKSLEPLDMSVQPNEQHVDELTEDNIEFKLLFDRYQDAQTLFWQILEDTKTSKFEEILKIYVETKKFDLNCQAYTLKRKYLELSKEQLNLAFDHLTSEILLDIEI